MNMTAPTTHIPIMDAPSALAPYIGMRLDGEWTQISSSQFPLPRQHTRWGDTSYFLPLLDAVDFVNRPAAWEEIVDELETTAIHLAELFVFSTVAPDARPTSTQVKSTRRPAWRPQIARSSTHEEIVAVLRMFGLDPIADRLGYLRSLVDDDPDEPTIEIESLRAMALFIMSERQLLDPRIGITPAGLIQIEWRIPNNGILAMEFLPSGLIRFAAISSPDSREGDRWRVNGTLPKEEAMTAVQPFTARIRLL